MIDGTNGYLTKRERRELRRQEKNEERAQSDHQAKQRRVFIWSTLIIIGAGLFYLLFWWGASAAKKAPARPLDAVAPNDWVRGQRDAKAVLIEYSDFQCPACKIQSDIIKQAEEEYKEVVAFVFRHFPLKTIHPNAEPASRAAEAAGIQNKFWEMHDLLFEKQSDWSADSDPAESFTGYAESLGLEPQQFLADYNSGAVKEIVDEAYRSGQRIPIKATPTYYLNGIEMSPFSSYGALKQALDQALAK